LDPVILAFLLPTTLKRYYIQIFANLPGSRNLLNKWHVKTTGFTVLSGGASVQTSFAQRLMNASLENAYPKFGGSLP